MKVFIDESPVDDTFVGDGTLEDTLRHVQAHLCEQDQMIIGVRCDGRDIPSHAMAETLQEPASSYERMEIFTGTKDVLVADALAQASACLTETESACQNAAELFTQGRAVDAAETLGECLRIWQQIHEAAGKSIEMLQLDPDVVTVNDEPLIKLIGRPKEVLTQVKEALQAQDHVLLADILQYEFPAVTQTWHTLIGCLRQEAEDLAATRDV